MLLRTLLASSLLVFAAAEAPAQQWPSRSIRFVVPLPPGGSPDYLSRLLAERLQPVLGQPLVVENKPGAGGGIARDFVAKAPADGYTILMSESSHVMSAAVGVKLAYDPIKDFEPISLAATIPFGLTVNSSMPVHTLNEFIDYAKKSPKPLTYGTAGIGAPHHFAVELLRSMTGINVVHVPYKGSAGIIPALLSGEIDFTIAAENSLLPHYKSGKLRPIAIAASTRTAILPGSDDRGGGPAAGLRGQRVAVMAPAGTPRPVIERLNAESSTRSCATPRSSRERMNTVGLEAVGAHEQLLDVMKTELAKYTKLARDAHIQPE
jgi:tripartite-type tricarboxylate transporter receptor subunit TctC